MVCRGLRFTCWGGASIGFFVWHVAAETAVLEQGKEMGEIERTQVKLGLKSLVLLVFLDILFQD